MSPEIVNDLAPSGTLRAAINMSNFLPVTGRTASGDPDGVSPDMACELARCFGVGLELLQYGTPGEISDDVGAAFLKEFVEEMKASGFVAKLIEEHGVNGRLSVAPAVRSWISLRQDGMKAASGPMLSAFALRPLLLQWSWWFPKLQSHGN